MRTIAAVCAVVLAAGATVAAGEHGGRAHPVAAVPRGPAPPRDARAPIAGLSETPTTAFDGSGRLWAAWVEDGRVLVSSSPDRGASWAKAVVAATEPAGVDANGEGRPKVAPGPGSMLYVTYTAKGSRPYTGDVRFTRSLDAGRTFAPPITLNGDRTPTGHRFDTVVAGPGGRVTVAWLDKRDADRAKAEGTAYAGASLYAVVSRDGGATFLPERKVADHVCECCRIAGATGPSGETVLFFRAVFGARTRDHALATVGTDGVPGPVRRATFDGWEIDGCPHHGPALAAAEDGTLHLAWYTGEGKEGRGLFYARLAAGAAEPGPPVRLGAAGSRARHPAVLAPGRSVVLAWLDGGGGVTRLLVQRSEDGGATFGPAREAGRTAGAADEPLLVRDPDGVVFLSWYTEAEGLTLSRVAG